MTFSHTPRPRSLMLTTALLGTVTFGAVGCASGSGSSTPPAGAPAASTSASAQASGQQQQQQQQNGGGGSASPKAGQTATNGAYTLAFAKCMRAHGIPKFPDPGAQSGQMGPGSGVDIGSPSFQAAVNGPCKSLAPAAWVGSDQSLPPLPAGNG